MDRNRKATRQLLILPLLTAVCLLLFAVLLPVLPSSPMQKERFWAAKVGAEPAYDFVFCGDSRVYRGIDPQVFLKGKRGLSAFNFGFSSAGLDTAYLNRAAMLLKPEGRKTLLIAVSPNAFLPSSLSNAHLWQWHKKAAADLWVKRHLYPLMQNFDPYAVSDLYKALKHEAYFEQFHPESGFVASDKTPADSNSALQAYKNQFAREAIDAEAVALFVQQLEQFRASGIDVYLFRMPASRAMQGIEDDMTRGFTGKLLASISERNFKVLEFNGLSAYSYDGSHLDSRSARLVSAFLSGLVLEK